MDQQGLAFVHGSFAALVFAFLGTLATVTSAGWRMPRSGISDFRFQLSDTEVSDKVGIQQVWISVTVSSLVFVQYVLGGLVRHRGMALTEHQVLAGIATLAIAAMAITSLRSGAAWLRSPARLLGPLVAMQLALGVAAWIAKLGSGAGSWVAFLGFEDYVPLAGSPVQVAIRTAHVLTGMLLFATTVNISVRTARLHSRAATSTATETATGTSMGGLA
jgi:cytochrome c oxidase assembly protein subunit 15